MIETSQPFTTSSDRYERFKRELTEVINRNSIEQGSNTPDFLLAQFLRDCLMAWDTAIQRRAIWYAGNVTEPQKEQGNG